MTSDVPPLSVVIPTFQRNDTLAVLLESLAPGAQTLPTNEYEVIVSDAGVNSTAETMLRERFSWAHRIAAPGAPPGANRNTGARQAHGEWLVFIDDDCRIGPEFLAGYLDRARRGDCEVIEGRITCREKVNSPFRRQPERLRAGLFFTGTLAVRRDVFFSVGPFDEDLHVAEDMEFGHRLTAAGARAVFCAEASADHPSQPATWRHLLAMVFDRRWFALYRCKTGTGTPLEAPALVAIARTIAGEVLYMARITWHLVSQHSPATWRFEWFKAAWAWLWSPLVVPYVCWWELRYRRLIRTGEIELRPAPPPCDKSATAP